MRLPLAVSLLASLVLPACGDLRPSPGHEAYPLDATETRAALRAPDGSVTFDYRARAETLYHCPGADVVRTGDKALVRLIRASIHDDVRPDVTAGPADPDGWSSVRVPDVAERAVLLDDGIHTRELLPADDGRP